MTSNRPYLVRAIYEWIVDNGLTPYLLVDASFPYTEVPQQFVQEGRIVLNVRPEAVRGMDLGNEWISFNARFSGNPTDVRVPVEAVLAIYARENGQGMAFPDIEGGAPPPAPNPTPGSKGGKGGPKLKLVK
ncbi:MAG: ClpXP protease specificity-enhancing factor [Chromatiales bacterium]|nr:ClpXP protease specificity-enhancing factor [Chromatiales bacterium]